MLPFTREQFVAIFVDYNAGVWPVQVLAYLVGLGMIAMLLRPSPTGNRIVGSGLAAMWSWTGIVYHGLYFAPINKAAVFLGALFVLQGIALFHAAVISGRLRFGLSQGLKTWLGWAFLVYASVLYPLVGMWAGHRYPEMPMFGITPCPVTIFTFGLLLLTTAPVSRWLLVIPFVWSLIGGSAAFLLGVPQDWPLFLSGVAVPLLILRDRKRPPTATTV